jgi:predicted DNA-binding ribbon-helix-helix protein
MNSPIVKRSIILNGHKTSISLENEFWLGLREIADQKKIKLSALLKQIDDDRPHANLSSAIRVFVLNCKAAQASGTAQTAAPVLQPGRIAEPLLA